ncbi:MAG: WD40 repeat domain-containing protein [Planctomycetaceae bacterium]
MLISGGYDKSLIWWHAETGQQIRRIDAAHDRWIRSLAVSPDGLRLATVADDMRTKIWDAVSGQCLLTLEGYDQLTPHGFPSMLYAVCSATEYAAAGLKPSQTKCDGRESDCADNRDFGRHKRGCLSGCRNCWFFCQAHHQSPSDQHRTNGFAAKISQRRWSRANHVFVSMIDSHGLQDCGEQVSC